MAEMQKMVLDNLKGMQTVGDPTDIPANSASDVRDMVFSPQSAISTRSGFLKKNTTAVNSIYGLFDYKTRFTQKTIYVDSAGNIGVM